MVIGRLFDSWLMKAFNFVKLTRFAEINKSSLHFVESIMKDTIESISALRVYMKSLEAEIREIRKRLENIEREIQIRKYKDKSVIENGHLKKIIEISTEIVNNIDSANIEYEKEPLKVLNIPEISSKLNEIKTALTKFNEL
jgi:hypothetical protein